MDTLHLDSHQLLLSPNFRHTAFDALYWARGARFLWPGMNRHIKDWASTCLDCQCSKLAKHVRPPIRRIDIPFCRFSYVYMDLVGPQPAGDFYQGLRCCLHRLPQIKAHSSTLWRGPPFASLSESTMSQAPSIILKPMAWLRAFIGG